MFIFPFSLLCIRHSAKSIWLPQEVQPLPDFYKTVDIGDGLNLRILHGSDDGTVSDAGDECGIFV